MGFTRVLAEVWILVPVAVLLVTGLAIAVRSVDVRLDTGRGAREVVQNVTCMSGFVAVSVVAMLMMQRLAGYNLPGFW